jgi:hypothetical protein
MIFINNLEIHEFARRGALSCISSAEPNVLEYDISNPEFQITFSKNSLNCMLH